MARRNFARTVSWHLLRRAPAHAHAPDHPPACRLPPVCLQRTTRMLERKAQQFGEQRSAGLGCAKLF